MPSPVTPSQIKSTIPAASGAACDKFQKAFKQFPALVSAWFSYMYNEDGTFGAGFLADICAINCGSTGAGGLVVNPNMPAPGGVAASTNHADRITLTWSSVTPAFGHTAVTGYNIFRSLATNTNPQLATYIATVPSLTYDDIVGAGALPPVALTHYTYWVEATNGVDTSSYSIPSTGYTV